MDILPFFLVCTAAFLHAFWNFLAKEGDEPIVTLWVTLTVSLVLYLPVFLLRLPHAAFAEGAGVFIAVTGLLHVLYFLALGRSYRSGDLSIVYPLARGSAPLTVALLAAAILGERISFTGGLGIFLVVAGIYMIHLKDINLKGLIGPLALAREPATRWALTTGLLTALYSVVDKVGVTRVSPEIYIYLFFALASMLLLPYILIGERRKHIINTLCQPNGLLRTTAGGICIMGAYGLVLFAMQLSKVSYVVAAREISVVLSAMLGVFILGEGGQRQKLLGSTIVAAGLVLLAISR